MPAEKQNKIATALDGLDGIPEGFQFDQKRIWHKISTNLPSNAKKKRSALLFAASLIFVITSVSLMVTNTRKDNRQHSQTITNAANWNEDRKQISIVPGKPNVISKDEAVAKEISPKKEGKKNTVVIKKTVEVVVPDSNVITIPVVATEIKTADTAVAVVAIKPKPRFRIAHINELNETNVISNNTADRRPFKKPFLTQVNESPNDGNDKLVEKKKKPIVFLPASTQ